MPAWWIFEVGNELQAIEALLKPSIWNAGKEKVPAVNRNSAFMWLNSCGYILEWEFSLCLFWEMPAEYSLATEKTDQFAGRQHSVTVFSQVKNSLFHDTDN